MPVIDFSKYPIVDPEEERKKGSRTPDITMFPKGDPDPLRDSYQDVQNSSPDAVAKVNDISRRLRADPAAVESDLVTAQHAADQPDWGTVRAESPVVADVMSDPAAMAVGHDDIPNLMAVEQSAKPKLTVGRLVGATGAALVNNVATTLEIDATAMEAAFQTTGIEQEQAFDEIVARGSSTTQEEYSKFLYAKEGKEYQKGMKLRTDFDPESFAQFAKSKQEVARTLADKYATPEEFLQSSGRLESAVSGVIGSSVPALLAGPAAPAVIFANIKGASIQSLRAQGITDPKVLNRASTIEAIGSTPLESAGTLIEIAIFSRIPGGRNLLRTVLGRFVKTTAGRKAAIRLARGTAGGAVVAGATLTTSAMTEGLEEYLQAYPGEYARIVAENPEFNSDEALLVFMERIGSPEFQAEAVESAKIGALGGLLLGGAVGSVGTVARKATAQIEALNRENTVEKVRESLLTERDPEMMSQLVNRAHSENGGDGKVYLQASKVIDELGLNDAEAIAWAEQYGVSAQELADAYATGADIALDRGKAAVAAAQETDPILLQIGDDLRDTPDSSSVNSAEIDATSEQTATQRVNLRKEAREANDRQVAELTDEIIAAAPQLFADRGGKGKAGASASLIAAHAVVRADALGITPAEALQQMGVNVVGNDVLPPGAFTGEAVEELPSGLAPEEFTIDVTPRPELVEAAAAPVVAEEVVEEVVEEVEEVEGAGVTISPVDVVEERGRGKKVAPNLTEDDLVFLPYAQELVTGKVGGLIRGAEGEVVGREPSLNPTWYRDNIYKDAVSTTKAGEVLEKARSNEPLTEAQELFVREAIRLNHEFWRSSGVPFQLFQRVQSFEQSDLSLSEVENFKTGEEVTFDFLHNTESATELFGIPDKDSPFGRGFEPSGRYMIKVTDKDTALKGENLISGTVTFQNPLVLDGENWKQDLSAAYDGLTGKNLSMALITSGYDGVVTVDTARSGQKHSSEILDLTTFDESLALFQTQGTQQGGVAGWLSRVMGVESSQEITDIVAQLYGPDFDPDAGIIMPDGEILTASELRARYTQDVVTGEVFQAAPTDGLVDVATIRGFFDPATATIGLTENADLSTFLHETGHFFLESLKDLAVTHGKLTDEWATVKEWTGATDGEPITREQHEQFADGFLVYLREGKAPTRALQGAFDRFKSWLTTIYRTLRGLGVQINDDVREVFDSMLATENQIRAAEVESAMVALLDEAAMADAGMTEKQMARYLDIMRVRDDDAARVMDSLKLKNKEEREARQVKEAKAEHDDLPLVKSIKALPEGMSQELYTELVGEETAKEVRATGVGSAGMWRGNTPPDVIADQMGFNSVTEMTTGLLTYETKTAYVARRTAEMEAAYEATNVDASLEIRNTQLRAQLETESTVLGKLAGDVTPSPRAALRQWAERTTAKQKLSDAKDVYRLIQQSRRLRQRAIEAQQKGEYSEAFELNEQVRRNEELVAVHVKVREEVQQIQKNFRKIGKYSNAKKSIFKKFDYAVAQQLLRQAKRFNLLDGRPVAIDPEYEGEVLAKFFIERDQATGEDIDILQSVGFDEWIIDERFADQWRQMTLEEVREINRLVDYLDNIGNIDKQSRLYTDTSVTLEEAREDASQPLEGKSRKTFTDAQRIRRKLQEKRTRADAEHVLPQYLFMLLDAADETGSGPNSMWFRAISDAYGEGFRLRKEKIAELEEATKQWEKSAKERNIPRIITEITAPEKLRNDPRGAQGWSFEKAIAVALNMGNEDNLYKLIDGYNLYDADEVASIVREASPKNAKERSDINRQAKLSSGMARVNELIAPLSEEDVLAVQKVWDVFESLFPDMNKVHKKLHGAPQKSVQARVITINGQTVKGGYFPLVYDRNLDRTAAQHAASADILDSGMSPNQAPGVDIGSMKARVSSAGGQPVKLSIQVIPRALEENINYITMAEIIADMDRVYHGDRRTNPIPGVVDKALGPEFYDEIRPSLVHIFGTRGVAPTMEADKLVQFTKPFITAFALGLNYITAVKQVSSLVHVAKRVGPARILAAYGEAAKITKGNPNKLLNYIHALSPMMEERWNNQDADIKRSVRATFTWKPSMGEQAKEGIRRAQDGAYVLIRAMDFTAAYPAWLAVYNDALIKGKSPKEAVQEAEFVIAATQPTNRRIDKSRVQRSKNSAIQLFNLFMSYTIRAANMRQLFRKGRKAGVVENRELVRHWTFDRIAPILLTTTLVTLARGDFFDEDKTGEEIAIQYVADLIMFQAAGRVLLSQLVSSIFFPHRGPVSTPIADVSKKIAGTVSATIEGKEGIEWNLLRIISFITRIPLSELADDVRREIED